MSMNPARSPLRSAAASTVLFAVALGAFAHPPDPGKSLFDRFLQAEKHYRKGQFLEAEEFYRQALPEATGEDRGRCYERLLAIYSQVGRPDRTVVVGQEYEEGLRASGDSGRAREAALEVGGGYLALGHYADAEAPLRRALAEGGGALPGPRRVTALTSLALVVEKQGRRDQAERAWRDVEAFARARLAEADPRAYVRSLSECYRFQKRPGDAVPLLEEALPLYDRLHDPAGQRDALRALAGHLAASKRFGDAARRLRQALDAHREAAPDDRLTRAELEAELTGVLEQQRPAKDARDVRRQAEADFKAVLEGPSTGSARLLAAYWGLQALYQRDRDYRSALKLAEGLSERWSDERLLAGRLRAEEGGLRLFVGQFAQSREQLRDAVGELEAQSPPNLHDLPRALLNLAAAELANDGRARAEQLAGRCRELYRRYRLPDDAVLAETCNLLGVCAAQGGDYAQAVDAFRQAEQSYAASGPEAAPQRGGVLLNLAVLSKAQGDLDEALRACERARSAYRAFAPPDSLAFAAIDAARADMLAALGRLDEAADLADDVLALCEKNHVPPGDRLFLAARHVQAVALLGRGEYDQAEKAWKEIQKLTATDSPLQARTRNFLALTQERRGKPAEAEPLYREALELEARDRRAFPATQFITLWRLALVRDARGDRTESRELLGRAVETAERARTRVFGDARQRSAFFAQFAPGFEQLVAWRVADGDAEGALVAAARSRSRTLLDQLQLAGVDPRADLPPAKKALRDREETLRREIAGLRARAQLLPAGEAGDEALARLLDQLDRAQAEYTEVYGEILSASPSYRAVGGEEFTAASLARLREKALGPKKVLLAYFVGRRSSYLLLLPGGKGKAEAFALTVPREVADRAKAPPRPVLNPQPQKTRGLRLPQGPPPAQPDLPPTPARKPESMALGEEVLRVLVDGYLEQISNPRFQPTRGLRLRASGEELPAQRPELLADVLLPPAARRRLRDLDPECVVIVPDGALHKLPFDALVVESGKEAKYALDVLPPLAYAPSVAALGLLAQRPEPAGEGRPSLLTAADPAYLEQVAGGRDLPSLLGPLPRLPFTREESKQIAKIFGKAGEVKALSGAEVTKAGVVGAAPGRRFVHIAAHGFADDRFGNQFGALALTPPPPGQATPENDGFLFLHDIYRLPLQDCALAVLSACETDVGPQRPLEAGVTLASGFLAAGARRVVASHWSVDDRSTAELMAAYFQDVADAAGKQEKIPYAAALRRAQRQVRKEHPAPFYWAPFVLIGPAE
jgi:CHAT domain-containing protein/Tfp pilus assembly protein PilF